MPSIDRLLEQQSRELDRLQATEVRAVLRAFDDSRRQLLEELQGLGTSPDTPAAFRLRATLLQVEQGRADLQRRLGEVLGGAEGRLQVASTRHLLDLVRAQGDLVGEGIEIGIARRLTGLRALALHKHSIERYGADVVDKIQRELAAGVIQGLTERQLARRIAGASGSVMSGLRGRAQLIARMETSRAYNDAHLDSMQELEAADPGGEPVLKRIDEFFDKRNHPFSRVANGTTAKLDEPFVVTTPPQTGMVWRRARRAYTGINLPAHFNDRGRITAWRPSWGPSPSGKAPPSPVDTLSQAWADGTKIGHLEIRGFTTGPSETVDDWTALTFALHDPQTGRKVGEVKRQLMNEGVVQHGIFVLDEAHQGRGVARELMRISDAAYQRAGLKGIELEAGLDAGKYVWARFGFDYLRPEPRGEHHRRVRKRLGELGFSDEEADRLVGDLQHAWEVAAFRVGDEAVGKRAMLDSLPWGAFRKIDPEDTGFQIGRAYYGESQ